MQFSFGEFSKLNVSLQSIVMGTVIIMPFFFLDIFIFYRSFFLLNPVYLIIILSYVLTISWLSVISFAFGLINASLSKTGKTGTDEVLPWSVFLATAGLIVVNALIYAVPEKATFADFIFILSLVAIIGVTFSIVFSIIFDIKRKKKNKQIEIEFKEEV